MSQPPTREEVFALVKHHLLEVIDGLTEDAIDGQKSLADSGASSLDIVEVVSCAMRDLKVKIPRAELALLENIDEVVDALYAAGVARASAAP